MRSLFFCCLVFLSIAEYLAEGRFGLGLVSAIFMLLSLQAELAAQRFLRQGLYPLPSPVLGAPAKKEKSKITIEDVIEVKPLGAKKKPEPKRAEPKKPEIKKAAAPPKKPAPLPQSPRFNGKPHEVLVVKENAHTQTIIKAFRHWVKKYHPDHAHSPTETQSANERTRCLTAAKEKLIAHRKEMRKPRAA